MLIIEAADPAASGPRALLEASQALMVNLFPPEENFALDLSSLKAGDIRFFAARDGAEVLGTGALQLKTGYGEVKSMFTAPQARGRGVADALLRQIEDEARAHNLPYLRLETGAVLEAAVRLYTRHGFAPCACFGDYSENESSLFMEKDIRTPDEAPK